MGTWGPGLFEHDHVMDWYCRLDMEADITLGVSNALDGAIRHHADEPGYGPVPNENNKAASNAVATNMRAADDSVERRNLDSPGCCVTDKLDIRLAAAELVAAVGGKPMPKGQRDILSGAEIDVASFVAGRLRLSDDLISKSIRVTDIVFGRKELWERWFEESDAGQSRRNVMDLNHRLQSLC